MVVQAPDWNSPVDWGELYSLQQDPHETVNLYRDQVLLLLSCALVFFIRDITTPR